MSRPVFPIDEEDVFPTIAGLVAGLALGVLILLTTGFFGDYETPPTKGAVVQSEVNPEGLFTQRTCKFLWMGCQTIESHYRIGVVGDYETGVIVVSGDDFEKYHVGSYYP